MLRMTLGVDQLLADMMIVPTFHPLWLANDTASQPFSLDLKLMMLPTWEERYRLSRGTQPALNFR